jgi:hypothetical protein
MSQLQREIAIVSALLVFFYASLFCAGIARTDGNQKRGEIVKGENENAEYKKSSSFSGCVGL